MQAEEVFSCKRDQNGTYQVRPGERPFSPTGLFKIRTITLGILSMLWLWYDPGPVEKYGAIIPVVMLAVAPLVWLKYRSLFAVYLVKLVEGVLGIVLVFMLGEDRAWALISFVLLCASPADDSLFSLPFYAVLQMGAWVILPAKTAWNTNWEDGSLIFELRQSFLDAVTFPSDYLKHMQEGRMREFLAKRAKMSAERYLLPPKRIQDPPQNKGEKAA